MRDGYRLGPTPIPAPEEIERAMRRARRMRSEAAHAGAAWIAARLRSAVAALWARLESIASAAEVVAAARDLAPSRGAAAPVRGVPGASPRRVGAGTPRRSAAG